MPSSTQDRRSTLPPGSELPPARQSARWIRRPLPFLQELHERHGDVFTVRVLNEQPWVIVAHPELVKRVFTASPKVLHAGAANRHFEPIVGPSSLLLHDEDRHMRQRRLLLPAFHGERMGRYERVMRAVVEAEVDRWPRGGVTASAPHMQAVTLEVILRAVFGVTEPEHLSPLRHVLTELLDYSAGGARVALLGRSPERLLDSRYSSFYEILGRADELVLAQVARRRSGSEPERRDDIHVDGRGTGSADLEQRDDVLSLLLQARYEDGSPLSDAELRDELMTLLVAGHETTATALSWALERLVRTPDALERTTAEADAGGGPYTDAVIQETLRLRPVFPVVARRVTEPFEIGGHEIPPGTTIMPCIALVHRRPEIYPDPDRFCPERFLERPPGTYTWIPFGGGVRRCMGIGFSLLEMRVVLSTLLARATVRAADPEPERVRRRLVTLAPSRGARVVLEPRLGRA